MSKKFKHKTCVYCYTAKSMVGDHVVAREFFPPEYRSGIPKVPACVACNTRKSELETYLCTTLPFASEHEIAQSVLTRKAAARLANNKALHRELVTGRETVWVASEGGLLVPTTSLPFIPQKAIDYFGMVAQGLLWYHFGQLLDADYRGTSMAITKFGVAEFRRRFWGNGAVDDASRSLAKGALWYSGRQAKDSPRASVWLIRLYDGIEMRGAGNDEGASAEMFAAMTLRRDTLERIMGSRN